MNMYLHKNTILQEGKYKIVRHISSGGFGNTYEGFDFIDPHNESQSIVTLMRKAKDPKEFIIAVLNFTPNVYYDYKIGVPFLGVYEEVLNSDDDKYWGSNQTMKNSELHAQDSNWHNQPYHIKIKVPPMGATFIKLKKI